MTWKESLAANYTDGMLILHRGKIVYERCFGALDEAGKHAAMSMTKSMTGLLVEILVAEGTLDPSARVDSIAPELEDSAFGDATVRQVMDMTTALDYSEDYSNPKAEIWIYNAAGEVLVFHDRDFMRARRTSRQSTSASGSIRSFPPNARPPCARCSISAAVAAES